MIIFRYEDVVINKTQQGKKTMGIGNLLINGKVFKCRSGGWGKGAMHIGIYSIGTPRILPDTKENVAYKKDGKPWFIPITALFDDDRTDLGIHADGNFEGSLGCPVIYELDQECLAEIQAVLKKNPKEQLKVI